MNLLYYEEKIKFRTNDFDTLDNIKPSAILDVFQDLAGIHANILGLGFEAFKALGYFWVLLKTSFKIIKQPKFSEELIISTWPHEKGRIDFNREYQIRTLSGEILITGISKWVIIDINTRRISRTDKVSYDGIHYKNNAYDDIKKMKPHPFELYKLVFEYKVLKTDIDHNLHMNNARYAELILNVTDEKIEEFSIEYIHECNKGDVIKLYLFKENDIINYIGLSNDKQVFISQVRTENKND